MKIQYGINRRRPGSRKKNDFEHQNHVLEIEGVTLENGHAVIIEAIRVKHPGWAITGYGEKTITDQSKAARG